MEEWGQDTRADALVYKDHPHHHLWVAGFFLLPLGAIGGAISTCGMHKLLCFKRSTVAPLLAQHSFQLTSPTTGRK